MRVDRLTLASAAKQRGVQNVDNNAITGGGRESSRGAGVKEEEEEEEEEEGVPGRDWEPLAFPPPAAAEMPMKSEDVPSIVAVVPDPEPMELVAAARLTQPEVV